MLRTILAQRYAANLQYAHGLVADIDDAASVTAPALGMNHPRWVLGHLLLTADRMTGVAVLGLDADQPDAWDELFKPATEALTGAAAEAYPTLAELLAAFDAKHAAIAEVVQAADPALMHTMVAHEMQHLGQLSAWRRASGLPRV